MKRIVMLIGLLLVILTGCSKDEIPAPEENDQLPVKPNDISEKIPDPSYTFKADLSTFHFIAGWLTDTKILYVEKNNGIYQVKYFDIETGESELVYEDESIITDIIIHPSHKYLLIHTSNHADAGILKIITLDGTVNHEMEIASTELSVSWNSLDPERLLITAFHEDWSFDIFLFDGHDEDLTIINLDDPFPKWAGENRIANMQITEHALDGGNLQFMDMETEKVTFLDNQDIIYFDTFGNQLLVVQAPIDDQFTFTLSSLDGNVISKWQLPAVSNYSEWIIPEIQWINETDLIFKGAEKSGQMDEIGSVFNIYRYKNNQSKVVLKDLDSEPIKCSPTGMRCLSGFTNEELIEMENGEKRKWIEFNGS